MSNNLLKVVIIAQLADLKDILAGGDFDIGAGATNQLYDFRPHSVDEIDLWVRNKEELIKVVEAFSPQVRKSEATRIDGFTHFCFYRTWDYEKLLAYFSEQFVGYEVVDAGSSTMYL